MSSETCLEGIFDNQFTGEHVLPYKNKQLVHLYRVEYIFWRFTSPALRSCFSISRQLCQTVEELLTLTGSDEAVQADVFLFALGETASLTLSWLILGLGLSQRQCLYLPLHTLSLQEGHAYNYGCILQSGCSWGSCTYLNVHSLIRSCR